MWEWEHENWLEDRELEVLTTNKDETEPECIDPPPRLREDVLALKSLTVPEKPAVTRCLSLESMTYFYLLGDASGQGFGSDLWDNEGLRYEFVKMVDTMERRYLQLEGGNQYYCQSL